MDEVQVAGIGDNNPPTDLQIFEQSTNDSFKEIEGRIRDLELSNARTPDAIENDEQAKLLTDFIGQCKTAVNDCDKIRTDLKGPLTKQGKFIQSRFNQITEKMGGKIKGLEKRLGAFQLEQKRIAEAEAEEIRRKAEEIREAELAEARKEEEMAEEMARTAETDEDRRKARMVLDDARDSMDAADADFDKSVQEKPKSTVDGNFGSQSYARADWKSEVVDGGLIPPEYLMVNETAIRAAVRSGVREIPGVRMWNEEKIVVKA